jgi:hypothetical protein
MPESHGSRGEGPEAYEIWGHRSPRQPGCRSKSVARLFLWEAEASLDGQEGGATGSPNRENEQFIAIGVTVKTLRTGCWKGR